MRNVPIGSLPFFAFFETPGSVVVSTFIVAFAGVSLTDRDELGLVSVILCETSGIILYPQLP